MPITRRGLPMSSIIAVCISVALGLAWWLGLRMSVVLGVVRVRECLGEDLVDHDGISGVGVDRMARVELLMWMRTVRGRAGSATGHPPIGGVHIVVWRHHDLLLLLLRRRPGLTLHSILSVSVIVDWDRESGMIGVVRRLHVMLLLLVLLLVLMVLLSVMRGRTIGGGLGVRVEHDRSLNSHAHQRSDNVGTAIGHRLQTLGSG